MPARVWRFKSSLRHEGLYLKENSVQVEFRVTNAQFSNHMHMHPNLWDNTAHTSRDFAHKLCGRRGCIVPLSLLAAVLDNIVCGMRPKQQATLARSIKWKLTRPVLVDERCRFNLVRTKERTTVTRYEFVLQVMVKREWQDCATCELTVAVA